MSFSINTALSDGLERVTDRGILAPLLALYVVHVGIMVGTQSQIDGQREELLDANPFLSEEMLPEELPLAMDLSLGAAWLIWAGAAVLFVVASIVAFRVLVDGEPPRDDERSSSDETGADGPRIIDETSDTGPSASGSETGTDYDTTPVDPEQQLDATHSSEETRESERTGLSDGLFWATIHGLVAAIIGSIAVILGLALLVIPGLAIATLFAFTHPYIATERSSAIDAMKQSLALTKGHRLRVFGMLVVSVLTYFAVSFFGGFATVILGPASVAGELVNLAFGALAWVVVLAILASAFRQLESVHEEHEQKWEGIDDELLP